tara:strand:- start:46 stop:648 length:603 start_codon:yes stop_codon:yes gene_type:complete
MSLLEKYQRVRNTFSYSIQSSQGIARSDASGDDIGSFQVEIPNVPFPENQQSKLGIFTFESFFFTAQTDGIYVSSGTNGLPANSDFEISGFYVEVNGLGLRPQIYTTNLASNLKSNKMFPIINEYGKRRETEVEVYEQNRVVSGGFSNKEVICSNPCGTTLQVKVYSMDTGELIADQGLDSVINFKIELLPDDFQEREMD